MNTDDEISQSVGRLIVGRLPGDVLDAESEHAIRQGIMGGVTLFKDNASSLRQLCELVDRLRELLGEEAIIAVDQEGGAVQRFDHVLTPLPSAMALGALADPSSLKAIADISARQLSLLRINCVLAPVLDVASNALNPIIATRSFGSDPEHVAKMGLLTAEAYLARGVLPVGKHFPGHGDTLEDSHSSLAVCHADRALLANRELLPFARCLPSLSAVLTGHVWLPAIDEKPLPSSLSERVTTGLLRQQMGFDGLVMTDDLPVMKAIIDNWGLAEAAVMAILAGADLLLLSGSMDQIRSVHKSLCAAVAAGEISQLRLSESLARRKKFLLPVNGKTTAATPCLDERVSLLAETLIKDKAVALETSLSAISVLRGSIPDMQHSDCDWIIVAPAHPRYSMDLLSYLANFAGNWQFTVEQRRYPLDPDSKTISELATNCAGKGCILLTWRAMINKGQRDLALCLSKTMRQGLVVATDLPFELACLPQWANAAATFDPGDLSLEALAHLLSGHGHARGTFPVPLT